MDYLDIVIRLVPGTDKPFIPIVIDEEGNERFRGTYYQNDMSAFGVAIYEARKLICPECNTVVRIKGQCTQCTKRGV